MNQEIYYVIAALMATGGVLLSAINLMLILRDRWGPVRTAAYLVSSAATPINLVPPECITTESDLDCFRGAVLIGNGSSRPISLVTCLFEESRWVRIFIAGAPKVIEGEIVGGHGEGGVAAFGSAVFVFDLALIRKEGEGNLILRFVDGRRAKVRCSDFWGGVRRLKRGHEPMESDNVSRRHCRGW